MWVCLVIKFFCREFLNIQHINFALKLIFQINQSVPLSIDKLLYCI